MPKPFPAELIQYLVAHRATLIPDLKEVWARSSFREAGTWSAVFGEGPLAGEVFQASQVARYIGRVAAAGKAEYPCLVQQKGQQAGNYPSGGPVAKMICLQASTPNPSKCDNANVTHGERTFVKCANVALFWRDDRGV